MAATRGQTASRIVSAGGYVYISSSPSQGSASASGYTVQYTPAATGASTVTFSIYANNGCYTSASRVVTVNISEAVPSATAYTGATDYNTDLTFSPTVSGVVSGLTIMSQPAHGTAVANGTEITYSPATGYSGPDSFDWRADGPGGQSPSRSAAITVRPPATPTLTGGTINTVYNQTGSLTLTGSNYDTLTIVTPPTNGTASLVGKVVEYASTGFIGSDTITVVADGPGGQATATINVNVAAPPAPTANGGTVNTAYITPISFTLPTSGIVTSYSLVGFATGGVATLAGSDATFMPSTGFVGAGEVNYTVSGPGGQATGTVIINVGAPGAPVVQNEFATTLKGRPVTVNLTATGAFTAIVLDALPANGQVVLTGAAATYTPDPAWIGQDTFTYLAEGVGPNSTPATVTIDTKEPPPEPEPPKLETEKPLAAPMRKVGPQGAPMRFAVAAGVPGVKAVELASQPERGSARIEGVDVLYQPRQEFVGEEDFDYRLITDKGVSLAAKLTAVVTPTASAGPEKTGSGWAGKQIVVDLMDGALGGPFASAQILAVSPAIAGEAVIAQRGPGLFMLVFNPAGTFTGEVVVGYRLKTTTGGLADGVARLAIKERPDPSLDREVTGLVNSQTQFASRSGSTQIANISRRLEDVRDGAGRRDRVAVGLSSSQSNETDLGPARDIVEREREAFLNRGVIDDGADATASSAKHQDARAFNIWAGGVLNLGARKTQGTRGGFDYSTSGVSAGADVALSDKAVVGGGIGFGRDVSDVGDKGTKSKATSASAFVYGSYQPGESVFVDGVLGYSRLDFDSTRYASANGAVLNGNREGSQIFGAISTGYEGTWNRLRISPYGRFEFLLSNLGAFAESGDDTFALRFKGQTFDQLTGVLGLRGDYAFSMENGVLRPNFRAEYRMALRDGGGGMVSYADWASSPLYRVAVSSYDEQRLVLGVGLRWIGRNGWSFGGEVDSSVADTGGNAIGLRVSGSSIF